MASEAEAVAGLVMKSTAANTMKVRDADGREAEVLILPAGQVAHGVKPFLDAYLKRPERKRGVVVCEELVSFIDVVNLHKRPTSTLFASTDDDARGITAVFDYSEGAAGQADWHGHRASYAFPFSEEWEAWNAIDGEWISQTDLAAHLEEHAVDVAEPATAFEKARLWAEKLGIEFAPPARMMGLSRGLAITVGTRIEEARNLGTGEASLRFESTHSGSDGKPLNIPGALLIEIPVFRNGHAYQLPARLRYRVSQNKSEIAWQVSLYRADRALADAVREACEMARSSTGLPLFYGKPEA